MKLKKFVKKCVMPNTLVRLWYPIVGGYEEVSGTDIVRMEWKLPTSEYAEYKVLGVKDILFQHSPYIEAVNIVIKRK